MTATMTPRAVPIDPPVAGRWTLDLDDPQVMAEFNRVLREAIAKEIREQLIPVLRRLGGAIELETARRARKAAAR